MYVLDVPCLLLAIKHRPQGHMFCVFMFVSVYVNTCRMKRTKIQFVSIKVLVGVR